MINLEPHEVDLLLLLGLLIIFISLVGYSSTKNAEKEARKYLSYTAFSSPETRVDRKTFSDLSPRDQDSLLAKAMGKRIDEQNIAAIKVPEKVHK